MSGIWTEHSSQLPGSTGASYYFNSLLQKTQWEYPQGVTVARPVESSALANQQSAAAVPVHSEWQATVDSQSGRVYYYNTRTSETSWENPNDKAAVDVGASYIEAMKEKLRVESQASFSKGGNQASTHKRKADSSLETRQQDAKRASSTYAQMVAGYGKTIEGKDIVLGSTSSMEGYAASGYGKAYM
jgi:hypothetical protein